MTKHAAFLYGEIVSVRADWSDASSPVERSDGGDWQPTGLVSDFASRREALRQALEQFAIDGGMDSRDNSRDDIDEAVEDAFKNEAGPSDLAIIQYMDRDPMRRCHACGE